METKYRIFVSYKRNNKDQVLSIVQSIELQLGLKCWIDLTGIESMAQFASKICTAIDECDIVLFMHSSEHRNIDYEHDWTIRELSYADQKHKRVVLLKLDESLLDNYFLLMFGAQNYIDVRDSERFEHLMSDLRVWLNIPIELPPTDIIQDIDSLKFKMIFVEGGSFFMGKATPPKKRAFFDEYPAHKVTLNDYYIGESLVTQDLWKKVLGYNPSSSKNDTFPVEQVSWNDVQVFIRELNMLTGRKFRLPTEAEWEYAARGGKNGKGHCYSGSNNLDQIGWYANNSNSKTHPVKIKNPNELGLYDMTGNVEEWCQDLIGNYEISPQVNPIGAIKGPGRVYRGGCYSSMKRTCQLTFRRYASEKFSSPCLGFRLAL